MVVDATRHKSVFDPAIHNPESGATIVGAGSIGSRLALHYAELGISQLNILDHDTIARENIANQVYAQSDVGKLKATVLANMCVSKGIVAIPVPVKITSPVRFCDSIVASCVDSMQDRGIILEGNKGGIHTSLFLDGRVSTTSIMVYAFDPRDDNMVTRYKATVYPDSDVKMPTCGKQSVGITAQFAATYMTLRTIEFLTGKRRVFETLYDWTTGVLQEYE